MPKMRKMLMHGVKMQKNLQAKTNAFYNFPKLSFNHDSSKFSLHSNTEILSMVLLTLKSFVNPIRNLNQIKK